MKKVLLGILALLLATTGCGSTPQPSPHITEQAAAAFMETLKKDYGYPVSSWEVDDEHADKAKKKGTAKATKLPASKTSGNKPPAPVKSSTNAVPPTTTTSTTQKIYILEVKFKERGCEWEAQKKLGEHHFRIDETTDRSGEEVDVDFDVESPTNAQFLAWVDLPDNRVKFDCYTPA